MSPMAFFFSASSTNTHCQPCELEPVGACSARLRHSISTSWLTGLSKSRRLRTERVVVRTSSTDRLRVIVSRLPLRHERRTDTRGFQQADGDHCGWLTTVAKPGQPVPRPAEVRLRAGPAARAESPRRNHQAVAAPG